MNETLLAMIRANTRQPVETEGDVYSLAACNDIGCERLVQMMDEFEIEGLDPLADYICDTSEQAVRREVDKLPDGVYRNTMRIDGFDASVDLVAAMTIDGDRISVDFDGTSPMQRHGVNVPGIYTTAYSAFGMATAIAPDVPNNAGSLKVYEVTAPEGSILNAPYPAAVNARHITGQMLPDVVFGCLAQIIPERIPAEGASCLWNLTFRGRTDRAANDSKLFTVTAVTNGGTGARPSKDGLSATAFPSGVKGTPVEINETLCPLIFHKKEFRPGSGGSRALSGRARPAYRDQLGDRRRFRAARRLRSHPEPAARPRRRGSRGDPGYVGLASGKEMAGKGVQIVPAGERLVIHTPGGGGHGDPSARDPGLEADDFAKGLVTSER